MQKTDYDENRFENWFKKFKSYIKPLNYLIRLISITIVFLAVIELSSFALVEIIKSQKSDIDPRVNMDVYKNKSMAKDYFIEFQKSGESEYYPYLGYRRVPNYSGEYINLDEKSIRKTINKCDKTPEKIRIFMFGGSTMWGTGASDEETIPSFLSNELCKNDIPVEVTNFAENGYLSTQEMIKLELELRDGNYPDIVIFYDGVNDVYSSFQTFAAGQDEAGLPQNNQNRKDDFNSRSRFNAQAAFHNFYSIVNSREFRRFVNLEKQFNRSIDPQLVNDTAKVYLNNIRIIRSLEKEYNFKSFFYWQPAIYTKSTLSEDEKNKIGIENHLRDLFVQTSKIVIKSEDVHDLTDAFNDQNSTIFIDWAHTAGNGNEIIAMKMSKDVQSYLYEKGDK